MQRGNERFVERLPLVLGRWWYAYVLTAAICLVAFLLRISVTAAMPVGYPFLSFFPAVILSSFLFGVRPGIFAGLLCGSASWYFFIPPFHTFAFAPGVGLALTFYAGVVAIDIALIHLLQRANYNLAIERERNRGLADNRELLFHELQHRVSNNLQVVAALLVLHRRHVTDESARRALDEASSRLSLIGKISRELYDPGGSGQSIRALLTTLAHDVMSASGREDIALLVDAPDEGGLTPEAVVPLSLIVAECVSNAIEHGFADCGGTIAVTLQLGRGGALSLCVADDGAGLAMNAAPLAGGGSLGLRIANALATQLGGAFVLEAGATCGVAARLEVPASPH
ncbi:MAG: histidine kinase dimerization/phosphoacceptor domain -containing protein [Sphingobium sp.]